MVIPGMELGIPRTGCKDRAKLMNKPGYNECKYIEHAQLDSMENLFLENLVIYLKEKLH